MLVCMAPTRILWFDLNNRQMTFKLKKVNFQGDAEPANYRPNVKLSNYAGWVGGTKSPFSD